MYKKHALVKIGNICNNNCIGCSISSGEVFHSSPSLDSLKREIMNLKAEGFESIELIGGEVTLEKNFFELLSLCRKNFKQVTLTTNGRILANEGFLRKILVTCPKLSLGIAIHGADPETHDAFTRTPGSFTQVMMALANISKYKKLISVVGVNTLVTKINAGRLRDILDLLKKNPIITEWYLLTFAPVHGRAIKNNKVLMPQYSEMIHIDKIISEASSFLKCVDLNEFPHCLFSEDTSKKGNIHFIDSDKIEVDENGVISSFNPTFSFNDFDYLSNFSAKKHLPALIELHSSFRTKDLVVCSRCKHRETCGGVWREYLSLYGKNAVEEELILLKRNRKKVLFFIAGYCA